MNVYGYISVIITVLLIIVVVSAWEIMRGKDD